MNDLDITKDGELMVAQVEGNTDAGIEFVDAYMPPACTCIGSLTGNHLNYCASQFTVVDSGRIIVPTSALDVLTKRAAEQGLTHEETVPR